MNQNELKIKFRTYYDDGIVFNIMHNGIVIGEIYYESPPKDLFRIFEYDITEILDEKAVKQLITTKTYNGDGIHAELFFSKGNNKSRSDRELMEEIMAKQDEIMEMLQKIYNALPIWWRTNALWEITGTTDTVDIINWNKKPTTTDGETK